MQNISATRKITMVWLIRLLTVSLIVLIVSIEMMSILPVIGVMIGIIALASVAIGGCWYIPAYYKRYTVTLRDGKLFVKSGVISHKNTVIPLASVLTFSLSATPLMRIFGIRAISLGLPSHRMAIKAMPLRVTEELRREIAEQGGATLI